MPREIIRDERADPRSSHLNACRVVAQKRRQFGRRRVADNKTAQRTPFTSGDPRSRSSVLIAEEELDAALRDKINLGAAPATPGVDILPYVSGVAVRDAVYWNGTAVDKASATSALTLPALGLVRTIDVAGPGLAEVQFNTVLDGFSGLVSGRVYIVSRALGMILRIDDTGNSDYPQVGDLRQVVGLAISATQLLVRVHLDQVRL